MTVIENDILNNKKIVIYTDSEYAIKCLTTYGAQLEKDKWNKNIPNKELVKLAYDLYKDKSNIKFNHIKAHTNNMDIHSIGNKYADKLANMAIK
jgi:ribonuclease HI